jgi:signal transduction histidine kinase
LGLKNMRHRAERLEGGMEIGTSREGGTRLTWHVPLPPLEELPFGAASGAGAPAPPG